MGVLTLLQFRTEVDSIMGNRTGVLDPRLDTWLNLAYNDIASGIDFEELDLETVVPTSIAAFSYTSPVDSLTIHLVRDDTSDRLLAWVPKHEFFRLDRTVTGAPKRWTRRGANILIWPPADAVYALTVLSKRTPAPLVGDGAVTILPPYVDNALIFLGASYGLLAVKEEQRAIVWLNRAISFLGSRLTNQDFSFLLGGLAKTQPEEIPRGS